MRQVTRKGLITVAAASGVLAVTSGTAFADSGADGRTADSPGVLAGNTVQVPVNIPVNLCGNTVNVVGLLNPAAGNSCANVSEGGDEGSNNNGNSGSNGGRNKPSGGGATAEGSAEGSPGVISGNVIQLPVDVPVNACGNSVTVAGLGNGTEGNDCTNVAAPPVKEQPPAAPEKPDTPDRPDKPSEPNKPETHTVTPPKGSQQLARTGAETPIGVAVPLSAGLLLAGAVLYRRARQAA
ncbi:chaplin family protein [Streptomyces sp. NPDC050418]|uniref:chaplin n=1 Tax=Streptomyces sp. NPDC050418 TaxID=3365612 RepID=UPI0037AAAE7B